MGELQFQDVQVFHKGLRTNVIVFGSLITEKWLGGTFARYIDDDDTTVIPSVEISDGVDVAGFLLRPSEGVPFSEYNLTSYQPSVTKTVALIISGGKYLFRQYEKFAWPNRESGTKLVYSASQLLAVSERGLLTTAADATSALGAATRVGICWVRPNSKNDFRVGLDFRNKT